MGNLTKQLKSVNLNGKDERILVKSKYANRLVPSPDNNWIAFSHLHKVYVAPLPKTGKTVDLDNKTKIVPISQIARDAGVNIHWSKDSKTVNWTLGDEYFSNALSSRFTFLENAPEKVPPMTEKGLKIGLEASSDKPKGKIAFTGARIITMEGDEVIENGEVLIENNRIKQVGPSGSIEVGRKVQVMDMSGKTITPGFVDTHAHMWPAWGIHRNQVWVYAANLGYGVTTTRDPQTATTDVLTYADMVDAGMLYGPRVYSTGPGVGLYPRRTRGQRNSIGG